jgi:ABC-type polar amino acid transport system ATPase subunit
MLSLNMDEGRIVDEDEPETFFTRPKSPRLKAFLDHFAH